MERTAGTLLRWAGRFFILLAAFILATSLFLPDAVQPLNGVVCPKNTELDNHRYMPRGAPDNEKLELVCTSPTYTESAAKPILMIVGGLILLGIFTLWFSGYVARPRVKQVQVPQQH